MARTPIMDEANRQATAELIRSVGADPDSFEGSLLSQQILTTLKMVTDGLDTGQLKLITASLKEMRYAYRVFNKYRGVRKLTVFGSARTPPEHPDYIAAREFSRHVAEQGWMVITGAGDGIMKAGHEGPQREASFGLSIRLPFETTANTVIEGDPKLINFRYFFTRKLMFMSHADAVGALPGGFGTQDELFETLTLIQTGKSNVIPVILLEGEGGVYWEHWDRYIRKNLLHSGWISEEDPGLYFRTTSVQDAVEHVLRFYSVYHSSRYVREFLVIRMNRALRPEQVEALNDEFASLIAPGGSITQGGPLEGETDHPDLPRLRFAHTRYHYGLIRRLIDRINGFAPASTAAPAGSSGWAH